MFLFLSITLPTNQNFSLPPLKKKNTFSSIFFLSFWVFSPPFLLLSPFLYSFNFFGPFYFLSPHVTLSTVHISTTFIFLVFISPFASRVFFLPSSSLLFILFYFFVSFFLTLTDKESGRYRRLRFFFFFEELANGWGNTSTLVLRANCLFVYCAEE